MTNAERAERARRAFDAIPHDNNDRVTQIYDLVCGLLHLADTEDVVVWWHDPDNESAPSRPGEYVAKMALFHYLGEVEEEREEDEL
jgi:hypothetical protein